MAEGNIVNKHMAGLPLGMLVCGPLVEVARGQTELCRVYLEHVFKLAYKDGNPENEVNMIKFKLQRPVTDGTGNMVLEDFEVQAPLLSLVPVPAFTMSEAEVKFTMEVKQHDASSSSQDAEAHSEASVEGKYFGVGFKVSCGGSVSSHSENTRSTDQSAKYDITAKAIQQPPAEGMAKLTDIFHSVIQPINVGSGAKA